MRSFISYVSKYGSTYVIWMHACTNNNGHGFRLFFQIEDGRPDVLLLKPPQVGIYNLPSTDLVRVQLALVHGVRVLNDFYLVLSKSFSIETLRRNASQNLLSY